MVRNLLNNAATVGEVEHDTSRLGALFNLALTDSVESRPAPVRPLGLSGASPHQREPLPQVSFAARIKC